jgi:hypothetical protein
MAVRAGALLEIVAAAPPRAQSWLSLESPRGVRAPYRLAIVRNGATYSLELRAAPAATPVKPRFYYAFAIGSRGDGVLLFPRRGSVENRFPLSADAPPAQIPLPGSAFRLAPPYGVETYFLLSTEEPLPNPWVLEFEGARGGAPVISGSWTLEKIAIDSRRVR